MTEFTKRPERIKAVPFAWGMEAGVIRNGEGIPRDAAIYPQEIRSTKHVGYLALHDDLLDEKGYGADNWKPYVICTGFRASVYKGDYLQLLPDSARDGHYAKVIAADAMAAQWLAGIELNPAADGEYGLITVMPKKPEGEETRTLGDLLYFLLQLPPECLRQPARVWDEGYSGRVVDVAFAQVNLINPSGEGCEPITAYADDCDYADLLESEAVIYKAGSLIICLAGSNGGFMNVRNECGSDPIPDAVAFTGMSIDDHLLNIQRLQGEAAAEYEKQQAAETKTYPCPNCQGGGCPTCGGFGTLTY